MHHKFFAWTHPLAALSERGKATSSRACPDLSGFAPTKSARQGAFIAHLRVMNAG
jgi:hypothetical protein